MATSPASSRLAALAGGTLSGASLGALVGLATARANGSVDPGRDTLVFALWCAATYALLSLPLALASALAFAGRTRRPFAATASAVALALCGYAAASRAATTALSWATEIDRSAWAAGLAGAGLAWLVAQIALRRRAPRLLAWILPALALVGLAWAGLGGRSDTGPAPAPALTAAPGSGRVVLFGCDGADWSVAQPLIEAGRLPHWEQLLRAGVHAPLKNQVPTWSPVIWNTIATGLPGSEHGILDFTAIRIPGLRRPVQRLRVVRRLALNPLPGGAPVTPHVGLAPWIELLVARGLLREQPVNGGLRRAKAVRNVLSDAGVGVASVRWWASWPAEELDGYVVSDAGVRDAARLRREGRAAPLAVVHPPELLDELAELEDFRDGQAHWDEDRPDESAERALSLPLFADLDPELREELRARPDVLRMAWNTLQDDRFGVAAARALWDRPGVRYLEVYTCLVDVLGHKLEPLARYDPRWRSVIERAYEESDALIGRLLDAGAEGVTWIVVSDHGWSYTRERWGHYHAPPGVFLASGPGIAPGAHLAAAPAITDVAPTVLALFGLPASERMPGAALVDVLAPDRVPPPRVPSLGAYRPSWPRAPAAGGASQAEIDRLRELGYVQ